MEREGGKGMQRRTKRTGALLAATVVLVTGCATGEKGEVINTETTAKDGQISETELLEVEKSEYKNPVAGFDAEGNLTYGGDPAALVDGDTVYLYTGHDVSTSDSYVIPEWQCYSTTDMKNWTYEGVVLSCSDIDWADKNSAWAGQVAKHYSEADGKEMYYFYYCSWDSNSQGKQSIGVAVSESPTGPFTDIGEALVPGPFTTGESSTWNDIDPTIWIETDENGEEHRYLAWGNGKYFICELNEDMISIKDLDGDGQITFGTDVLEKVAPGSYTEAPWLYRQQDENGNYFGDYYIFYAAGWREEMAYATTDDLLNGKWVYGDIIMEPTATSNTNHMSVIDFQGKTYFIYHNGSLEGGSGYRRVACVEEITINEDGTIDYIEETAVGLFGTSVTLEDGSGSTVSHASYHNAKGDDFYPYSDVVVGIEQSENVADAEWVFTAGKAEKENKYYISIESNNKPGLYLTCIEEKIVLAQDVDNTLSEAQTFQTVRGLSGEGVSFESVLNPGMYITVGKDGILYLTDGADADAATFEIKGL